MRHSSTRSCGFVVTRWRGTRYRPRSTSCRSWRLRRPANWRAPMRNVIVTGGSRGLGLGIARRLTSAGYRVIAVARKEPPQLTAAMEEADRANPGSLQFVSCDLAEIDDIPALVEVVLVRTAAAGRGGGEALGGGRTPTPAGPSCVRAAER